MDKMIIRQKDIEGLQSMEYAELIRHIPPKSGLIIFRLNTKPLFHIRTNNLTMLFESLFTEDGTDNEELGKVINSYDELEFRTAEDKFDSLVLEKRFLVAEKPEFHRFIRLSDDYVYLAINCRKSPFVTIQQDTAGKDFYLGPFFDRFMLVEVTEIFAKYLQTPSCKPLFVDSAPKIGVSTQISYQTDSDCGRKDNEQCKKYCEKEDREELASFLAGTYLQKNDHLLQRLDKEYQAFYDGLQFISAEELKREKGILENYYQAVRFLVVIKYLKCRFTEKEVAYTVENGMLTGMKTGSDTVSFLADEAEIFSDYRENELLALPKEHFQEMGTVYEKIAAISPEVIEDIYRENIDRIKDLFQRSNDEN